MNIKIKKIIVIMTISVFSVLLQYNSVSANDEDTPSNPENAQKILDNKSLTGKIIYEDDEVKVVSFENNQTAANTINIASNTVSAQEANNNPRTTANGSGGIAKLNAGDNGRTLYWSVKPDTIWPYNFNGNIKVNYYSGKVRNQAIGGFGALHQTLSGYMTMKKNKGGSAKLTGTAVNTNGVSYRVLPSVQVAF